MKILQLIYTSCKKGLSSGAGFQTFSMSRGITEEERREIERYGLYVPPTNLPTQPTEEEIKARFPVASRFFRLESGRFGICQSRYIGCDYSGRYGNYFSHALIFEKNGFPVYPIQWYNSPVFRDHLTEIETRLESTPPPLPPLEMEELTSALSIRFDDVMEFIDKNGIDQVKQMVSAAISYDRDHRSLILSDLQTNIPYWIAAIQMAFPLKLVHNLTFSTYAHDPAGMNVLISGIPRAGSRFLFSDTQRNYEYYIFDFDEQNSHVIDSEYKFTKNVDLGYTVSKESLREFHNFIALFDFDFINKELDSIDALFRMARIGLEDLNPEQILAAVEFANKYASPVVLGQLSDSLFQIRDSLIDKVDAKSAEIVAKFLFKIARQSSEKKHLETAYRFFFRILDHLIIHYPRPDLEITVNFYCNIMDENRAYGEEFAKLALSSGRLKQMTQTISNAKDPLRTEIYFNLAAVTVTSFRYGWDFMMDNHPVFESFIQYSIASLILSEENLKGALSAAAKDKDFFVQFISFCLARGRIDENAGGVFLNAFIRALADKPTDTAVGIRLKLVQEGHGNFIYQEYLQLLRHSTKRREFFQVYFDQIFSRNLDFMEHYFSRAVNEYLELLPDREYFDACSAVIDAAGSINDNNVMKRVVEGFEKGVPMSEPDKKKSRELEKKLTSLVEIKKERRIFTVPDITRLVLLGIRLEKAAAYAAQLKISSLIDNGTLSLEQLEKRRVNDYYKWCLPNVIRLVNSSNDHKILFQWFGSSKLDKLFALDYIAELKKVLKEEKESGTEPLTDFLKFYLSTLVKDRQYFAVREKLRESLVKILSKLSKSRFSAVRARINSTIAADEPAAARAWRDILQEVDEKNKKSFFNRMKRVFGSGKKVNEKKVKKNKIKIKKIKKKRR